MIIFKRNLSIPSQGLFNLSSYKQTLLVKGPDSTKFLNGLTTSKLLPTFTKKNQHTISDHDLISEANAVQLSDQTLQSSNWGIIHEDNYLDNDDLDKIGIRRDGVYSMLLNSKGRVITDLFIYPTPFNLIKSIDTDDEPSYLLEMDSTILGKVMMMLQIHKLKSQVKITKQPNLQSWYYYNDSLQFNQLLSIIEENYFNNSSSKSPLDAWQLSQFFIQNELIFNKDINLMGFAIDDRSYLNGIKFITSEKQDSNQIFNKDFIDLIKPAIELLPYDIYKLRNNIKGIVEKSDLPQSLESLPFEHNIDYMNGISYDKGCYVGQELTIRTKNHGVIRKRIMPFKILTQNTSIDDDQEEIDESFNHDLTDFEIPLPETITTDPNMSSSAPSPFGNTATTTTQLQNNKPKNRPRRRQTVGKILEMRYNYGFALINLKYLTEWNTIIKDKGEEEEEGEENVEEYIDFPMDPYVVRVFKPQYFINEEDEDDDYDNEAI